MNLPQFEVVFHPLCYWISFTIPTEIAQGAESYLLTLDDEIPVRGTFNHRNITELDGIFLCEPDRYLRAKTMNLWLFDGWNIDSKAVIISSIRNMARTGII